jgi:hypothetical protein
MFRLPEALTADLVGNRFFQLLLKTTFQGGTLNTGLPGYFDRINAFAAVDSYEFLSPSYVRREASH